MHKYSVVCIRTFLVVLDVYWTNGRRGYHIIEKECVVPEIIIPRSPYIPLTCHMYSYNCSFPSCIAHAASHIPSTSSSSPQHRPGHTAVNLNSSLLTHSSSSDNLPAFPGTSISLLSLKSSACFLTFSASTCFLSAGVCRRRRLKGSISSTSWGQS